MSKKILQENRVMRLR